MLKTIPSFMVSSIFTFKLQLATIALLNTIASNIFSLAFTYPNLVAHSSQKYLDRWTPNLVTITISPALLRVRVRKDGKHRKGIAKMVT